MNGIFLTAAELDALHGAGPLATTLYVYLRSWMDLRTREVGVRRAISLAMLATYGETHTSRNTGEEVTQPTQKMVRTALDRLARRGLLHRQRTERLVFLLPMALTGNVRPKNTGHSEGTELSTEHGAEKRSKARAVVGVGGLEESIQGTEKREVEEQYRAHIGDQRNTSTYQSSSTTEPESRARRQRDDEKAGLAEKDDAGRLPADVARLNALAALLRMQGVSVGYDSAVLGRWVDAEVSDEEIAAALGRCRTARGKLGSDQPIGIRYLDSAVQTVRAEAERARAAGGQSDAPRPKGAGDWRKTEAGIVAKGREVGMAAAPGETWSAFARRIDARLRERGE